MVKLNIEDMVYSFLNIPFNLFSLQLMLLVNHSWYLPTDLCCVWALRLHKRQLGIHFWESYVFPFRFNNVYSSWDVVITGCGCFLNLLLINWSFCCSQHKGSWPQQLKHPLSSRHLWTQVRCRMPVRGRSPTVRAWYMPKPGGTGSWSCPDPCLLPGSRIENVVRC